MTTTPEQRIDRICVDVENSLRDGKPVDIESEVSRFDEDLRGELLKQLLLLEMDYAKTPPDKQSSIERFPALSDTVRSAFRERETLRWEPPAIGDCVGKYEIREVLGEGSFGSVYKAWDRVLKRCVALKAPRLGKTANHAIADAFFREATSVSALRHPNIVVVHDIIRDADDWPLMVLECLEPAFPIHNDSNPIQLAEDFANIANGLDYAHQKGIVHRDLKPENILRGSQNQAVVADFGLALHCETVYASENVAGTLRYMSPEQIRGETHWMDGRADIWAIGVMLYESLCGRPPFVGDKNETAEAILAKSPRPPRQIKPDAPKGLERICLKCLEKSPEDRYLTAGDLAEDLERFANPVNSQAKSSFKRIHIGLVASLVAACCFIAFLFTRADESPIQNAASAKGVSNPEDNVTAPLTHSLTFGFENGVEPAFPFDTAQLELVGRGYKGTNAVQVSRTAHSDGLVLDMKDLLKPMRYYWIAARVKSADATFPIQMQMEQHSSGGMEFPCICSGKASRDWELLEGSLYLPTRMEQLWLIFRTNGDGWTNSFFVDEVTITEMEPGPNLLLNGGFESSPKAWKPVKDKTEVTVTTRNAHRGNAAAFVAKRSVPEAGIAALVEVEPKQRFHCEAHVKGTTEGQRIRIIMAEHASTSDLVYTRVAGASTRPSGWQNIAGGFTAMHSRLRFEVNSDDNEIGDFYVDSVRMIPLHPARDNISSDL